MSEAIAVIGGGIAGLAFSIDLRKRGYDVIVIEKGHYPRHKVCGEYIAVESRRYLYSLCPALKRLYLPRIRRFQLTSTGKSSFKTNLEPGGFGISRYTLELLLYEEAVRQGVRFLLDARVSGYRFDPRKDRHVITTNNGSIDAKMVCNATGRRSNLGVGSPVPGKKNSTGRERINYVGVKYHADLDRDDGLIEIHNFPGGYCGVSGIEDEKTCICYIVNAKKLNSCGNSIGQLQEKVLFRNGHLKTLFTSARLLTPQPITVSGIHFKARKPVYNNVFFLGDAAGAIAPITGNGMSNALRSAYLLANLTDQFFSGNISRQQLDESYNLAWNEEFVNRIYSGRFFQRLSESPLLTNSTIGVFNLFPSLGQKAIERTHGKPF